MTSTVQNALRARGREKSPRSGSSGGIGPRAAASDHASRLIPPRSQLLSAGTSARQRRFFGHRQGLSIGLISANLRFFYREAEGRGVFFVSDSRQASRRRRTLGCSPSLQLKCHAGNVEHTEKAWRLQSRMRMRMRECEYGVFRGKVCVVLMRYNEIISRERHQQNACRTAASLHTSTTGGQMQRNNTAGSEPVLR